MSAHEGTDNTPRRVGAQGGLARGGDTETEERIRLNPWARTAHGELDDWLAGLGAAYAGCAVDEDGTRELRWTFPPGQLGAGRRRWRELLVRALGGDHDRWELIYREASESRLRGTVYHYDAASTRSDLTQLRPGAAGLVDAGLQYLPRPVASCGHALPDPRLLSGLAVAVVAMVLILALLADGPVAAVAVWILVGALAVAGGWLAVQAIRHAVGFRAR